MKNLVMTTVLTLELLIPGISFAGNVFGVDSELTTEREKFENNIVTPSHTAKGLNDTLVPQKIQGDLPVFNANKYDETSYIFGVDLDSENIG